MSENGASPERLAELREAVLGPVLTPGDPAESGRVPAWNGLCSPTYEDARKAWNGMFDRRPSVIVLPMGVADVQAAVAFARANDLPVAVRGGGHSLSGASTIDGGVLIDLRLMRGVRVDPERRIAVAAAGTLFSEFDRETQLHGLATTGGMISHTGIAGLTLGGGVGRFMKKRGLSCDNVLGFDVVTADGEWRHVDADHEPELFWALRGGGGGFAVVTHFEYALHPLGPTVFGGFLGWPLAEAREVFSVLREEIASAPDDLALEFIMSTAPEAEFVPPQLQGQPILTLVITWMGDDHAEGERYIAPFRQKVVPPLDVIAPFPYALLQSMLDYLSPHGRRVYNKIGYVKELTDELTDTAVSLAEKFPNQFALFELTQLGGAVGRVDVDATPASAFREPGFFYIAGANWIDEDDDEASLEWTRAADAALGRFRLPGRYINFLSEDDEEDPAGALGAGTFARLAAVKAKYDPSGLFSRNPNVRAPALTG